MRYLFALSFLFCFGYTQSQTSWQGYNGGEIGYRWISDSMYTVFGRCYFSCVANNGWFTQGPQLFYSDTCVPTPPNFFIAYNYLLPATMLNGKPNGSEVEHPCLQGLTTCDTLLPGSIRSLREYYFYFDTVNHLYCGKMNVTHKSATNVFKRDPTISNLQPNNYYLLQANLRRLNYNEHNSTNVINHAYPYYFPINQPVSLSLAATDADGDSLVYHIVNSKHQLYQEYHRDFPINNIPFVSPYTLQEPFATNGTFEWDSTTAIIKFTADTAQNPLITMLVDEYRNGVWMGNVLRDIPLIIMPMPNVLPQKQNLSALNTNADNMGVDSFGVYQGLNFSIAHAFTSTDINAHLQIESDISSVLPGCSIALQNNYTDSVVVQMQGVPNSTDLGWHTITLSAKDSNCAFNTWQTYAFRLFVNFPMMLSQPQSIEAKVYPNPVNEGFQIAITRINPNTKYSLTDMNGQVVKSANLSSTTTAVDTHSLPNGVYILRISSPEISQVEKVCVVH